MYAIATLILLPLLSALLLLVARGDKARNAVVAVSAAAIAAVSVFLFATGVASGPQSFDFKSEAVDVVCGLVGATVPVVVIVFSVRHKNVWAALLAVVQLALSAMVDLVAVPAAPVTTTLYYDNLTLVMVLLIGVVGCGICVYACGYMEDFQAAHAGERDRRPGFFAVMHVFLSAMYLIVFSNDMSWLFTGWEVTTLCSFLLIAYTRTDEAVHNAFRQILMNMAGGIAFAVALLYSALSMGTLDLAAFVGTSTLFPGTALLPLACLSFAGLTKSAQMPFHTWLLGAMVAPTPTSALLHSSTMVKAGVFLLIKLAPAYAVSPVAATMLVAVGGVTFCLASMIAISQTNAKRVLAYSTVANLGLIVALAGVATPEAVWAAVFLLVFHAAAKSLMFLCVGTAEHHIGSRDIEDMDLLFSRMPRLSRLMALGAMVMFVAPFGMLVAKWATLVSLVDARQYALIALMAFGSAATFAFWAKWLGKLSAASAQAESVEDGIHRSEWFAIRLMAALSIGLSVLLPLASAFVVQPYVAYELGSDRIALGYDVLALAALMSAGVAVVMLVGHAGKRERRVDAYLSGVASDVDAREFVGSMGAPVKATQRNMYMPEVFGERRLAPVGDIVSVTVIVVVFAWSAASALSVL